jgi:hypothetical protein
VFLVTVQAPPGITAKRTLSPQLEAGQVGADLGD